jgi:arsenite methyltransferase
MASNPGNNQKTNYGIDAPGVIRNLFLAGVILFALPFILPAIKIGSFNMDITWFIWPGMVFIIEGILMLIYSLYGKYKHRNRMLNLIDWKGNEQVLDVGTGKGLLMIGAAKKLTTGKSTGIDIWNEEDLTGNNMEAALKNAGIEGVENKIGIKNENAMNMGFADNSFDVILTNLCLHNIYNKEGRNNACREISRVLKTGGTGVISDFKHVKEYKSNFDQLGLQTQLFSASYFTTFPPLRILVVRKL